MDTLPKNERNSENTAPQIALGRFIARERVVIDLEVSSRKRLFEQMAKLIVAPTPMQAEATADPAAAPVSESSENTENVSIPDVDAVLHALVQREKLGCTGIGNGIALPHGRLAGVTEPLIAIARLKHAINYDAPDNEWVWLAVCLLVSEEAEEAHLQLLATLAACFKRRDFLARLKNSRSASELAAYFQKNTG